MLRKEDDDDDASPSWVDDGIVDVIGQMKL